MKDFKSIMTLFLLTGAAIFSGFSAWINAAPETSVTSPSPEATPVPIAKFPSENFAQAWREQYAKSLEDLDKNRKLWAKNSVVNYDFVVGKMMGGNTSPWNRSPVIIKVRDGQMTSIETESKTDTSNMARTDGFEEIDTIDKMFDYLRRELGDGKMLNVEYDKRLGYPKSISLVDDFHVHGSRYIKITKLEKAP